MSEKESVKNNEKKNKPQTSTAKRLERERRYTGENKKVIPKLNEQEAGPRGSRGKKQRREFKLAPNRG